MQEQRRSAFVPLWLLVFFIPTGLGQLCPILPPTNVELTFSEEFITTAYEAMKLNMIALEQESGPIDSLIEQQREIYEIFNGWSDIDDQGMYSNNWG